MRAPFRAIEPLISGVSTGMRGLAASTVSRDWTCAPGAAGTPTCGAPGWPGAAGAGGVPGAAGAPGAPCFCACCCCCCWACCWRCFSAGMPMKYCHPSSTIAESTIARKVFLLSVIWISLKSSRCPWLAVDPFQRAREFGDHLLERQIERGPPADQHVVVPGGRGERGIEAHDLAQAP